MRKLLETIVEMLIGLAIPAFIILVLFAGLNEQDKQVQKHCQGLSGYDYGVCTMKIYK